VIGGWNKLHNEELHKLYPWPNIIRIIKSRRMRRVGNVARMGIRGILAGFWWGSKKERDQQDDLDLDGRTILNLK
jgi:hypothetical protein